MNVVLAKDVITFLKPFFLSGSLFVCLAEDLAEAIYKPIESTALFAVNKASIRQALSESFLCATEKVYWSRLSMP